MNEETDVQFEYEPEYLSVEKEKIAMRVDRLCELSPGERHEFLAPRKENSISATDRFILWKNYYAKNLFYMEPSPAINFIDYLRVKTGQRDPGFFETMCTTMPGTGKTTGEAVYIAYRVAYGMEAEVVYQSAINRNVKSWNPTIVRILTNGLVTYDFGELVPDEVKNDPLETPGKVNNRMQERSRLSFVLSNGVQLTAIPVGTSIRGARSIYTDFQQKHTYLVLDDTVSTKTSRSDMLKQEVKDAADEAKRSRDPGVGVIRHLTNMIQYPNIAQEIIKSKEIPYLIVPATRPVIYFDGKKENHWVAPKKTNWDSKWVLTDKEAEKINERRLKHERVGSLEREKVTIGQNYVYEYECETPDRSKRLFPDFEQKPAEPERRQIMYGMQILYYRGWNEGRRNVMAIDVSLGRGGDPSVIVVLDDLNNVIACGSSREIHPADLTNVIIELSDELNTAVVAPENNSYGQSVVDRLAMDSTIASQLYRDVKIDRITKVRSPRYGFNTNASTKQKILSELGSSIDSIVANDPDLLNQLMEITIDDVDSSVKRTHNIRRVHNFDYVIALAIANYVIKKEPVKSVISFMGEYTPKIENIIGEN